MSFHKIHRKPWGVIFTALLLALPNLGTQMPTLVTLPYEVDKHHLEANLQCILNVLRQINYQRTSNTLPEIDHLYNHVQPGIQREIDMQTLLLQYFNFKPIKDRDAGVTWNPRKMITDCALNLKPAIERCKAAYGYQLDCEQVTWLHQEFNKAPFVTPKCPQGYQRYGCCKCLRTCAYTQSIEPDVEEGEDITETRSWTNTQYCVKKPDSKTAAVKVYSSNKGELRHRPIGVRQGEWNTHRRQNGELLYIENCPDDFMRVGNTACVAVCPLGWPDMGRKCMKRGSLLYFPFVWQPGDGNLEVNVRAVMGRK
jgi:hypothetical protein